MSTSSRRPDRLWGLPNGNRGTLSLGQSGRGVRLTIHLQLVPRPRKRGSIHPLPHTLSWRRSFIFYFIYGAGVEPSPLLLRPVIGLLYQPWMIYGDDCGVTSGINGGQGKPKYSEKNLPPCRSLHHRSRAQTLAAAVGSRRLTAWAMARPWGRA
jgi:hypothetical protein